MRNLGDWVSRIKELWSVGRQAEQRTEVSSADRKYQQRTETSTDFQPVAVETPWGYLLSFAVLGAIVVALYGIKANYRQTAFALTLAVCAMVIGIFLGFLFGVPRTVQTEQQPSKGADAQTPDSGVSYRANTNLEQISDWLTKILVGVGLTQLNRIPEKLGAFGDFLAAGMNGGKAERSFGILTFLFFSTCGFLVGFLWTRLYLQKEFKQADLGVLAREIQQIKSQPDKDARALSLALRQLSPTSDAPVPSEEELKQAIREASAPTRLIIFEHARNARKYSGPNQLQQVEKTIPVFKALTAADDAKQFHRNYGQLGYALKEKTPPDYQAAIEMFSQAMAIRDNLHVAGYHLYELNRADCLMKMNPQPTEQQKQRIIADLKAVQKEDPDLLGREPAINAWLSQNKVQL